ncbi:hypothetical protein C5B42_05230, partial [Candidatus Cerribacteria bacterium 'Amazon FNV 2010 28 9']
FLFQTNYLRNFVYAAKTPFLPFSLSPSNLFTFIVLFLTLLFLSFRMLIQRKPMNLQATTIASLAFLIILLEQKSIIRSIDWQVALVGFVLFELLCGILWQYLLKTMKAIRSVFTISFLTCFSLIVVVYPFRPIHLSSMDSNLDLTQQYETVVQRLHILPEFNGKVFSYPADPLLYKKLNQFPPYFFTGYESTPEIAQEKIISYIQQQQIHYVVLHVSIDSLQDGVPDYIRNSREYAYLLTHFEAIQRIGDFLILQQKENSDPDEVCQLAQESALCHELSTADLESLPLSEGRKFPSESFTSLEVFNSYLSKRPLQTKDLFLAIRTQRTVGQLHLQITSEKWKVHAISFAACSSCLIHLDRLPAFYVPTAVTHISIDDPDVVITSFYSNDKKYW